MTTTLEPRTAQGETRLSFNEEMHAYSLNGRPVPGVTETISRLAPHRVVDEWYLQRGSAVHAAVPMAMNGILDWDSVDPRIAGRVNSVLKFIRDCKITPIFFERRLASIKYQFAGTLDFFGDYRGQFTVVADWKGSLCPQVELQMGAYSLLLEESGQKCERAVAVETHDDGTYRCRWFTAPQLRVAGQQFLCFLSTRNWLEAHIKNS